MKTKRLYLSRIVPAASQPRRDPAARSQIVKAFIIAFIKPETAGPCFDFLPGPLPKTAFGLLQEKNEALQDAHDAVNRLVDLVRKERSN